MTRTAEVGKAYETVNEWYPRHPTHVFGQTTIKYAHIILDRALQPMKVATVDAKDREITSQYPGPYGLVWTRVDGSPSGLELEDTDIASMAAVKFGHTPMPYVALAAYLNAPGCALAAQGGGQDRWVMRRYYVVYAVGELDNRIVCIPLPLHLLGLDCPNVWVASYQLAYKPDYRVMLDRQLP